MKELNKDKEEIISHHQYTINWVKSLEGISEEQWESPINEGKWSVGEIIGHLIPWDKFVLEERIPFFDKEVQFPPGPNVDESNRQAAQESRIRSKEDTINAFIQTRNQLLEATSSIPDVEWNKELSIGNSKFTLIQYFRGLAEHDTHHINQIKEYLNG